MGSKSAGSEPWRVRVFGRRNASGQSVALLPLGEPSSYGLSYIDTLTGQRDNPGFLLAAD
ncbi:hypothetical protein T45_03227 [Streptomyces turgidiscabies]|nr:hypothetical protein T45_03227 [Streptomyces turgidiscabies]